MENENKELDALGLLAYAEDMTQAIYELLVKDDPNISSAATVTQVVKEYIERAYQKIENAETDAA